LSMPGKNVWTPLSYIFNIINILPNLHCVSIDTSASRSRVDNVHVKSVPSSLPWSTALIQGIQQVTSDQPLAVEDTLLNTSFTGFQTIPVTKFRTSEATLQILDTAARAFDGK
uniref:Polyprotein n=1 Tax=Gongylonema pulchrum TaxID=637853 RepID=A0A183DCD0_9BILA